MYDVLCNTHGTVRLFLQPNARLEETMVNPFHWHEEVFIEISFLLECAAILHCGRPDINCSITMVLIQAQWKT